MGLAEQLSEQNKYQTLLRELLEAQRNHKSEQLSKEQQTLFEAGRHEARRSNAPATITMTSWMEVRVPRRAKLPPVSAADASLWRGI
ncbi:MAG: hypothetical protein IANPNBLG_04119 [Bryobacteraceae bacterium]|nr:hypothetical protein [Bryobacteraceae bacterium]